MAFSSLSFLLGFLPLALILYYIVPAKIRGFVLILLGLAFYAWGEPAFVLPLVGLIVVDFLLGQGIARARKPLLRRLWLAVGIVGHVAVLLAGRIYAAAPPFGMAVYTLMAISYLTDHYREEVPEPGSLLGCASYLTLFPLLTAGPVVSYRKLANALRKPVISVDLAVNGIGRFIVGLSKKVLLADVIGLLWDRVSGMSTGTLPAATAWLGILAFAFQFYFDLSGYSDMATGLGQMLGFSIPQNFNYPYLAHSIREFWGRWNITLGQWFRRYVYTPWRGEGRRFRSALCLVVVFALVGLWYGFSWHCLLWGVYFALLFLLERYVWGWLLRKLPRFFQRLITMIFVMVGWVLFACGSLGTVGGYLAALFGGNGVPFGNEETIYLLLTNLLPLVVCSIGTTRLVARCKAKLCGRFPRVGLVVGMLLQLALLALCICYLVTVGSRPFLLFRF